ncbi:MAG TPA: hypothetical protein VMU84_16150 [Thermoanaerobaculia bacterium]|nr:hypothetical protein [Thermoanaerobaculia bacterium]
MRKALIIPALFALLLAGACRNEVKSTTVARNHVVNAHPTPDQLGVIGAQIQANPSEASRILGQHGMTEASFEEAIRKVTENEESAKQYTAAYKRAGGR